VTDSSPARAWPRVVVIVPVGTLEGAKSRLGGSLDAEERRDLVVALLERLLAATRAAHRVAETFVVTPDADVCRVAEAAGARPIAQHGRGLNHGLREARVAAIEAGADAVLVLPVDLPLVTPDAVDELAAVLDAPDRPLVALVPDRHGRGTNALLVAPPDAIDFGFGGDSRAAHRHAAAEALARYVELRGPLELDIDTPDDLLLAETPHVDG
jgi:2-phospho-L-lactate/phosphoenolpyruvate guanylyltransferase